MAVNRAHAAYQANSIAASKPEEITMMLYNGLVRFITNAKKAIDENNIEETHKNLVRAQDILAEFQASLDMNIEISKNLFLLYDYMYYRLVEANMKKDSNIVAEVLSMASQLRDTWDQIIKKMKEEVQAPINTNSVNSLNAIK
jgi:flagellar secretion chaperone FliS